MRDLTKFEELGLSDKTLNALIEKGYEEPTEIQEKVIPLLLKNDIDVVGQAQTGTGKTAAFGLPLLELIDDRKRGVKALVVTPTRELAIQVSDEINSLKGERKLRVLPVYGGQSISHQIKRLGSGVDIVVGTPGRLIDHLERRTMNLDSVSFVVLDEADEMLNMGFIEDIEKILDYTPFEKRVCLFSATMPQRILQIAQNYMKEYEVVRAHSEQLTTDLTDQIYFEVNESDKLEALSRIVDIEPEFYGIVFCRTKQEVDFLGSKLQERGYDSECLHGDISQFQRERIMRQFKSKRINILVATDVAARGIDVNDLTHVINYSLPQDPESYVHRIGRTGRAGKKGIAITFVTPQEYRRLVFIKRVAKTDIRKGRIPKIKDIMDQRRGKVLSEIQSVLDSEDFGEFMNLADDILELYDPRNALAACLKYSLKEKLDENQYSEISEVSMDTKGKTRLFVAQGRKDGMTPKKLVTLIMDEIKISSNSIKDIDVFENFSFLSVPFEEAEMLVQIFDKKAGRGRRPLLARAENRGGSAKSSTAPKRSSTKAPQKPYHQPGRKSAGKRNPR